MKIKAITNIIPEISSAGINLNIYKDIEDHDRSIQMPEVYKNGKIIFGEFLL